MLDKAEVPRAPDRGAVGTVAAHLLRLVAEQFSALSAEIAETSRRLTGCNVGQPRTADAVLAPCSTDFVTTLLYNAIHLIADAELLRELMRDRGWLGLSKRLALSGSVSAILAVGLTILAGWSGFGLLRLLAWGVFAHTLILLLGAAWIHRRSHSRTAWAAGLAALAVIAVTIDAFVIEPQWLQISRSRIQTSKLTEPVRIVVLADIQTDGPGEYERRAITAAMAEEPDLILLPGDYIHLGDEEYDASVRKLRGMLREAGLAAPLGVYAVRGDTERDGWAEIFEGLDVHCFENSETLSAGEFSITGLRLGHSRGSSLAVEAQPGFHIAFGHNPNFALGDVDADLLVAGHCHGGQVRIPFFGPPVTLAKIPRAWTSGTREIRLGTWLSVSRGIGLERARAPRLRFLCRPEVVVIDLIPNGLD